MKNFGKMMLCLSCIVAPNLNCAQLTNGAQECQCAIQSGTIPQFIFKMFNLDKMSELYNKGIEIQKQYDSERNGGVYLGFKQSNGSRLKAEPFQMDPYILSKYQIQLNPQNINPQQDPFCTHVYNFVGRFITMANAVSQQQNFAVGRMSSSYPLKPLADEFNTTGLISFRDFMFNRSLTFENISDDAIYTAARDVYKAYWKGLYDHQGLLQMAADDANADRGLPVY